MTELPIAAHAVVWLLLLILSLLVVALSRQLKVLFERVAPAGALMVNARLEVGGTAPRVSARSLSGSLRQIGMQRDDGLSQLVVFVAPDCPISRSILPAVTSLAGAEPDVRLAIASDGYSPAAHRALVAEFGLKEADYLLSEELGRLYGVSKLPYAVLLDPAGHVTAFGIINSREHLESLFEARELGVASLQDYFASQGEAAVADSKGLTSGKGQYHDVG